MRKVPTKRNQDKLIRALNAKIPQTPLFFLIVATSSQMKQGGAYLWLIRLQKKPVCGF